MAQLAQASQTAPVPPQNLEAEESVLGAMMLSPGAIGAVSEELDASDFYRESHAVIYRAALALYSKGEPVDAITLVDELEERGELEGAGGRVRIHELATLVPASANAGHYARIVHEMATLRGLIRAGGEIAQLGWERPGETTDLVELASLLELVHERDRVDRLALCVEDQRRAIDLRVTLAVEVRRVENLADRPDRAGGDHHRAENRLLGFEILGRNRGGLRGLRHLGELSDLGHWRVVLTGQVVIRNPVDRAVVNRTFFATCSH
jgi:hypothetical protein